MYNYEDVLRQINYYNNRPAFYLSRTFKLKCSELNGRFNSNEFRMEVRELNNCKFKRIKINLRELF